MIKIRIRDKHPGSATLLTSPVANLSEQIVIFFLLSSNTNGAVSLGFEILILNFLKCISNLPASVLKAYSIQKEPKIETNALVYRVENQYRYHFAGTDLHKGSSDHPDIVLFEKSANFQRNYFVQDERAYVNVTFCTALPRAEFFIEPPPDT